MQRVALTAEESAFLARLPLEDGFAERLTQRLARVLTARLRTPVRLAVHPLEAPDALPVAPRWRPDSALATLWLTRRLGGRRPHGASPFVSPSLLRTLDTVLAECWSGGAPPAALAWAIESEFGVAALAVELPQSGMVMTRWAREVVRHA